jgi:acetyl esterase/lipase
MWLPVMLTTETVPLRLVWRLILTLAAWALGGLDGLVGGIGLAMTAVAVALLLVALARGLRAGPVMRRALAGVGIDHDPRRAVRWGRAVAAYPYRIPAGIERIEALEYAPGLFLDVYRSTGWEASAPVAAVVNIHSGGWHGGNRRQTARPLLHEVARRGWIGVAVDYPLTPQATWPEPMVALKRALWWLKTEGAALGIDPDRIVVTGGSAGAHLAAHLALSAGDPSYQPGFEDADLTVAGAVPLYGIFDLLNRNRTRDPWPFIAVELMKSHAAGDLDRWRAASPLDLVRPGAPPFLVIHGSHDSLVPERESRQFAAALEGVSTRPVAYAVIPGATHGFDTVESVRTHHVTAGVLSFVSAVTTADVDTAPGDVSLP